MDCGGFMILLTLQSFISEWGRIIAFVAVALVFALSYIFIKKYREEVAPKKQLEKDNRDKSIKVIQKALNKYIRRNDGRVIYMTEVGGKKTKGSADAVLIGYFGVLVLIGCGLSGSLYANEKDKYLTQIIKGEKRIHENPVLKAQAAAKAVIELLKEKKIYKVPVDSGVVFSARKVEANVPRSLNGFTAKEFSKALHSKRFLEDKGVNTDAVAEIILGLSK